MRKSIVKIYFYLSLILLIYGVWYGVTGLGIPCYYLTVHGYECPGCGLSRMVFSLVKFQFGKAFAYNPVGFVVFFIWNTVAGLCWWQKPAFVQKPKFHYFLLALTVAAFLIQGLFRNLY